MLVLRADVLMVYLGKSDIGLSKHTKYVPELKLELFKKQ